MKQFKCMLCCILLTVSILCGSVVKAENNENSVKHAYTLTKVSVLDRNRNSVATIPEGTTFKYIAESSGYVKLKYKGKNRYVAINGLVLDDQLTDFVKQHRDLFDSKIRTIKKAIVYCDRQGNQTMRTVSKDTQFYYYGEYGEFYKVQLDGKFGYLKKSFCKKFCMIDVTEFPAIVGKSLGIKIANYGKRFVGNPYVWGGTSLTAGCDCSGFVQAVYRQFGYNLPRCSYQQAEVGRVVSFEKLKPGDLIFYYRGSKIGHVTLYVGNGNVVQARGSAYGIVITRYDYSTPAFARRIIK